MTRNGAPITVVDHAGPYAYVYKGFMLGGWAYVVHDEDIESDRAKHLRHVTCLGSCTPASEGVKWARGWYTPAARALRTTVALSK